MGRKRLGVSAHTKESASGTKTAVAYLRVSTDEQHLGLEAQRAALETWAAASDVTIVAWHTDQGVSGGAPLEQRPALMAALSEVAHLGATHLAVHRRDRLARDVYLAAGLERTLAQSGASIVSADGSGNGSTPEAQLMRTILDGMAQYERSLIRARTRAALAAKVARNEVSGTIPFGYQRAEDGRTLAPCPREQVVLTRAKELRAKGLPFRVIAEQLAMEGLLSRAGTPLPPQQIWKLTA